MYSLNQSKFLSPEELGELKRILKSDRDSLLIRLALATGARASELLNIKYEDLFIESKTVFIKGIKGSNNREIPIKSDLFALLIEKKGINSRIFPISRRRLIQIWHNIRPIKKKFHSLRHSFAMELYQKTKDIRLVQVALGHRGIENTLVYLKYDYTVNELRKAML